jgi:hypothetical protein
VRFVTLLFPIWVAMMSVIVWHRRLAQQRAGTA